MTDYLTIIATVLGVAFFMKYYKPKTVEKQKSPTPEEFEKLTAKEKLNEWRKK